MCAPDFLNPPGDAPIVITRDDLTAGIRQRGRCSCPHPSTPDPRCPQHGDDAQSYDPATCTARCDHLAGTHTPTSTAQHAQRAGNNDAGDYLEVITPGALPLPADVPLTLDFGSRAGTAHIDTDPQGGWVRVTAHLNKDDIIAAIDTAQLATFSFGFLDQDPPGTFKVPLTTTLRMTLGQDGIWRPDLRQ
jgi:hypothetical protein